MTKFNLLFLLSLNAFAFLTPTGGGSGGGTVTSVAMSVPSFMSIAGSPITDNGTLAVTLATETANTIFSGPTTGSAATPTFRALVAADIPNLSATYSPVAGSSSIVTVGTISSGVWSGASIANSKGGTGGDSSAQTGLAHVASGTWSYSTLVNADVNASAAIALSKLAATTVSRALVSDSSGFVTAATTTATEIGYVNGVTSAIQTQLGTKAPTASPAFTTQVTFGNYHLEPCENDSGNSGTTKTIDLSTCSAQKSTLTGNVTYTLSNPVTGGTYVFRIIQGASSYTATWPAAVKWAGGTAPVISTTNGHMDLISLYWDGTDYYGTFSQNYTP